MEFLNSPDVSHGNFRYQSAYIGGHGLALSDEHLATLSSAAAVAR
jgi:hypothetical protein